jgi:hypothetical protein
MQKQNRATWPVSRVARALRRNSRLFRKTCLICSFAVAPADEGAHVEVGKIGAKTGANMDGETGETTEIGGVPSVEGRDETETETVSAGSARPKRGRLKGVPNKITRSIKEEIREADPAQFLIRVMQGRCFKRAAEPGARHTVSVFPTLQESIDAGETLLRKIAADLKATELSGPGENAIEIRAGALAGDPRELARAFLGLAQKHGLVGGQSGNDVKGAGRPGKPTASAGAATRDRFGATAPALFHSQATGRANPGGDEADPPLAGGGIEDTPPDTRIFSQNPNAASRDEIFDETSGTWRPISEMQGARPQNSKITNLDEVPVPKAGEEIRICDRFKIRALPLNTDRPGPPTFETSERIGLGGWRVNMPEGSWKAAVGHIRKHLGDGEKITAQTVMAELPPASGARPDELAITARRSPGARHSRRDDPRHDFVRSRQ